MVHLSTLKLASADVGPPWLPWAFLFLNPTRLPHDREPGGANVADETAIVNVSNGEIAKNMRSQIRMYEYRNYALIGFRHRIQTALCMHVCNNSRKSILDTPPMVCIIGPTLGGDPVMSLMITAVVGSLLLSKAPVNVVAPQVIETRTIELKQTVTLNDVPKGARQVRMWVPIPSDGAWQRVTDIKVDDAPGKWQLVHPQGGKGDFIYVDVVYPEAGSVPVTISCVVERQGVYFPIEEMGPTGPIQKELFVDELNPKAPLMECDERVTALANEACGNETDIAKQTLAIMKKVAEVADHYSKNSTVPTCGRGAASDCMDHGGGCCSDLHSLFVAMARSRGIPARINYGYRTLDKNDGKENVDPGYRCWAEAFVPGMGWVGDDIVASDGADESVDIKWPVLSSTRIWLWEGRSFEMSPPSSSGNIDTMLVGWAEIDGKSIDPLPGKDGSPSQLRRSISFKVIDTDRTESTPALPQ